MARKMADLVRQDMEKQFHILRGNDQYGQSVMIKYPRTKPDTTESSYVMAQIYMAERSTAVTEFMTRATRERSVAVFSYVGFDRSLSPGFTMQVAAATKLQQLYPERLETLVFVEPPFWLQGVLSLLHPFLSESITKRLVWATGSEEREKIFSSLLGPENNNHAIPLMRKHGLLKSPVSLEHFLVHVPFVGTYDSLTCEVNVTEEELQLDRTAFPLMDGDVGKQSFSEKVSNFWGTLGTTFLSSVDGEA
jgi:hypothetical protein